MITGLDHGNARNRRIMEVYRRYGERVAESYTTDGTEWTVRKKGTQFEVVRINRANGQRLDVAWVSPSATWAGKAAARQGYRQGRQDAISEIRQQLEQLQKSDPGPLSDDAPDTD